MAWIETPREDGWEGDLAAIYGDVVDKDRGRVDNIFQIHALKPAAMAAHNDLYVSAMSGTATLRKVDRELIALVVSDINKCHY
jgi:alkylhydroperoxidase family enzyme